VTNYKALFCGIPEYDSLTLILLVSYIHGAPCKARNVNVCIGVYGLTFGNAEGRLFLFAAQYFNIE
jgi:hypothetical protein